MVEQNQKRKSQKRIVVGCLTSIALMATIIGVFILAGNEGGERELSLFKAFQGAGDMVTAPFEIAGEPGKDIEFEVKWAAQAATGEDVFFSWTVHSGSVDNPPLEGNPYGVLEGSVLVQFDYPASFVIEVIASSNCAWIIEIWTA